MGPGATQPTAPPPRIVIIGTGGHGRQLLDILRAEDEVRGMHREVLGFLDDGDPDAGLLARMGTRCLGPTRLLGELDPDVAVAIGVADPAARARLDRAADEAHRAAASAIHPTANLASLVDLGDGAMISASVMLDTNVTIGRQGHINFNASIGHDTVIGDHVTVLPGARISGNVVLEDEVTVASNAVVFPGVRVGARTVVGAGALVRKDLPADLVYTGLQRRR